MVLTVKVESPRASTGNTLQQALSKVSTGLAFGLAARIQKRVFSEGRTAQPSVELDSEGQKLVSPRYGAKGGKTSRSGAQVFESGTVFQAAQSVRRGSFNVSGGLAGSLSVIPARRDARVQFRGRSEGQEVNFRRLKKGLVAKGKKVSNGLKAATVLRATGINLLALTQEELDAIGEAVQATSQGALSSIGGRRIQWRSGLPTGIARNLLASIVGLRA